MVYSTPHLLDVLQEGSGAENLAPVSRGSDSVDIGVCVYIFALALSIFLHQHLTGTLNMSHLFCDCN